MAEKRSSVVKHLFLILVGIVLVPVLTGGCSRFNGDFQAKTAFAEANALFVQGSYQASLDRYARIADEQPLTRDRVLFEMGIIHAHPKNAQKDYQQALECFQTLIKDYPESAYRQNSETMIFTITNVTLKDSTIATLQSKIEDVQADLKGREEEVLALKQQIEALEQKHFAFVLEKGEADRILIEKAERRLTLLSKGEVLKTYRIALGGEPRWPESTAGRQQNPRRDLHDRLQKPGQPLSPVPAYLLPERGRPAAGTSPGGISGRRHHDPRDQERFLLGWRCPCRG